MNTIPLETPVLVVDSDDRFYGEVGIVRNDWLKTFRPEKRIYSVELSLGHEPFDRDQLVVLACPACDTVLERPGSCPSCDLPLNQIIERTLA